MKNGTSNRRGFTMVELMIVVAVIGLLAAIAVPTFVRARDTSQANTCMHNLREIAGATQIWALEQNKRPDSTVTFSDIKDYLKRSVLCPAAGSATNFSDCYVLNGVTNQPGCLILPTTHILPSTGGDTDSASFSGSTSN